MRLENQQVQRWDWDCRLCPGLGGAWPPGVFTCGIFSALFVYVKPQKEKEKKKLDPHDQRKKILTHMVR